MLLHRLVPGNMVEKTFVTPSLRREVGTSLGIEIHRDLVNTPQIVVKTGYSSEHVINGTSRTSWGNRMAGNDLGRGVRPLEPGDETSESIERDLSEINIALIQMFEVFNQWNDKFALVVKHNIADTMIAGKNFS